ncbi:outer membrane protein assembly factor BamE [Candidatus Endowatersipora endosymbiont of Watersipora subatra]|uniref:outer membrane protein assembly factor BamE n=1 Tax=Candidatus Endowatersipora endosymbiont of Watersipora subatra TaxID=3077946 RepID=UPI00312C8A8A
MREPLCKKDLRRLIAATFIAAPLILSACHSPQMFFHGYQLNGERLALVLTGSSRDQVLLLLGTPSHTILQPDKTETFYYIIQKKKQQFSFQRPRLVDQKVIAISFTKGETVRKIAHYGLKDGIIFDFIRQKTPIEGNDLRFINRLLHSREEIRKPMTLING